MVTDVITSSGKTIDADQPWFLNGYIATDLPGYAVHELLQNNRIKHLHSESIKEVIGLSTTQVQEKLANRVMNRNQDFTARRYFIRIDGVVFPFPEEMIELLESFADGRSLSDLLTHAPEEEHEDYQLLLEHCVQHNFVRIRKSIRAEETKELILHE